MTSPPNIVTSKATAAPRVSAFMSVYNGEAWVEEAVSSVLNQTETDFELIVIDDGSTDSTPAILDRLTDRRVVVWHKSNEGLGRPLNSWLRKCRGEFIMRLDADDICEATRMKKQADFLDAYPNVVIVGSQFQHFVGDKTGGSTSLPCEHEKILQGMRRGVHTISHATTMWRRSLLDQIDGYRWDGPGEDWSLLFDAARHGEFANLPDTHYFVRLHPESSSAQGARSVVRGFRFARARYERYLEGIDDYTIEQFEADSRTGFLSHLALSARARSLILHRQSQAALFRGDRLSGFTLLAGAIVIDPKKAFGALWKRARFR